MTRPLVVLFAIGSSLYWLLVAFFWSSASYCGLIAPEIFLGPTARILTATVPGMLYALLCMLFCRRLAKRFLSPPAAQGEANA